MAFLEFLSECRLAFGYFFERLGVELAKKEILLIPTAYDMNLYFEALVKSAQKSASEKSN